MESRDGVQDQERSSMSPDPSEGGVWDETMVQTVISIGILIFEQIYSGAKVIAVLITRIFGEIVPISLGIILNALSYLLVSKLC